MSIIFWFQEVLDSVSSIDYYGGGTNTAAALEFARLTAFTTANGMRSHAAQVAVVITDGESNEGGDPSPEAERLRDKVRKALIATTDTGENN